MTAIEAPRLSDALREFVEVARGFDNLGPLDHLRCPEVDALAGIAAALGESELAERMLNLHALADDDAMDRHHDRYLEAHADDRSTRLCPVHFAGCEAWE